MSAEDVVKLLLGALGVAGSVIAFLFYRIEKANGKLETASANYITDLKAEHAQRLSDKDKATTALLTQNDKLHLSLERVSDILEMRTSGKKIPP